jgi:hypothetical protein
MRLITIALFISVIIFGIWRLVPDIEHHPLSVDEHEFVRKTYFFDLFFIKHNYSDPRWYEEKLEDSVAQPKAGPYIYGAALHVSGIRDTESALARSGFNSATFSGRPWWVSLWTKDPTTFPEELKPSVSLIMTARRTALGFTIGSVALLFILCAVTVSAEFAYISTFLLLLNPLFYREGRFAMTDTMQLFFFFAALLGVVWWKRMRKSGKRTYVICALLGVVSALATGVKVTGIMSLIFILLFQSFVILLDGKAGKRRRDYFLSISIVVVVFGAIFYLLHPFLYAHPVSNFVYMFQNRLEGAQTYYAHEYPSTAIATRPQALRLILERTLLPGATYGNFGTSKAPIDILLFCLGAAFLFHRIRQSWRAMRTVADCAVFPLWVGFIFLCLAGYLNNDWSRYYLPFVAGVCMFEGYAVLGIWRFVAGRVGRFSA